MPAGSRNTYGSVWVVSDPSRSTICSVRLMRIVKISIIEVLPIRIDTRYTFP